MRTMMFIIVLVTTYLMTHFVINLIPGSPGDTRVEVQSVVDIGTFDPEFVRASQEHCDEMELFMTRIAAVDRALSKT